MTQTVDKKNRSIISYTIERNKNLKQILPSKREGSEVTFGFTLFY